MEEELQRLKRLLVAFGVVTLLLLVGFVIFVSTEIRHLKSQIATRPEVTEKVIERPAAFNFPTVEELRGEPGKTVVGPQGEPGAKGEKGDPGAPGRDGRDGADGKDGRDGKNGASARELELCKLPITLEIGQRFVGTDLCLPIEVGL